MYDIDNGVQKVSYYLHKFSVNIKQFFLKVFLKINGKNASFILTHISIRKEIIITVEMNETKNNTKDQQKKMKLTNS
jgi:hypothetical protein